MGMEVKRLRRLVLQLERIKKECGTTWSVIAESAGVSRCTMLRWVHMQQVPSKTSLAEVMSRLGITEYMLDPPPSIDTSHIMSPLDFTAMAREYTKLSRDGSVEECADYLSYTLVKVGAELHRNIVSGPVEPNAPKLIIEFLGPAERSFVFFMDFIEHIGVYSVRLYTSLNSHEMKYELREHCLGLDGRAEVLTIFRGDFCEVGFNRIISYLWGKLGTPNSRRTRTWKTK